ncbi:MULTISPECIES: hypothetical protein [unclassified Haematobacter]|uniref:hypothetical protein n=1 Tax=unclassified Haematobacter TaxID=2640585 RepID=UPI0025BF934B|nr:MULTISPECIES: hypothetical protein [unclassified Haematobacter]
MNGRSFAPLHRQIIPTIGQDAARANGGVASPNIPSVICTSPWQTGEHALMQVEEMPMNSAYVLAILACGREIFMKFRVLYGK